MAGPGSRGRPRARRGRRTSPRSRSRSSPRGCPSRSWSRPPGRRPRRSAAATSAAAPTAPASASSRRAAGRSTTPTSSRRCWARWRRSRRPSTRPRPAASEVSLADLIVLGGCAAVEQAARNAGHDVEVPFTPGRTDASQEQTDVESFAAARADRGRVPQLPRRRAAGCRPSTCWSTGRNLLTLSAPEMTVLVGGLRVLGANHGGSQLGVLTAAPESLTQRLLRQPARPGHGVEADVRGRRRRPSRAATAPPARSSGPAAASTWSSARTPSCARSPRSTRATTRERSSCTTSSPRGTR